MKGYRGFFSEIARTGSAQSFWLQVRGGLLHWLRSWTGARRPDAVAQFVRNYGPEGFAIPDGSRRTLVSAAQRCLVCGMCSAECARVGGTPPIDPQEAVVASSRLSSEAKRFGYNAVAAAPCGSCRACHPVCPVAIPIAEIIADFR